MSTASAPVPEPRRLSTPEGEDALVIEWQDDHLERLPFDYLRGACPCVTCKGSHREVDISRIIPKPGVFLVEYQNQGRYALRLLWSDAHYTGIYTYTYLRSLCPCAECKSSGGKRPV
ncbi:MAG: DUF971 domain-containing protein [Chloroflexi bacterium]|nr:DUF971 domain-containing protein [Chloroflexota bacterium]